MWFKLFIARVFRIPMRVMDVKHHPDELPPKADQVKAMAGIFHLVPGLYDEWRNGLGQVIAEMAKTPADEKNHGRRIQLCERAVFFWQCLSMPEKAATDYNGLMQQHPAQAMPPRSEMLL